MVQIVIYFEYGGKWKKKEDGSHEWCSRNKDLKGIILDDAKNGEFSELVDSIYDRLCVNRRSTNLKVSYLSLISKMPGPIYILDDFDVKCYLLDRCPISQCRSVLHVELIEKNECGEDNDKWEVQGRVKDGCGNGNKEIIRDECFDVGMEEPMVYDAASAPGCHGDRLDEPTMEESLQHDTVASAQTPNPQSPCLDLDVVVDHSQPPVINDNGVSYSFEDGLDFEIGQQFGSKSEVKNLVINASLKACFDFNIVKSTTTLFVAKCAVQDCKWAFRAAKIKNSDHFSLRTHHKIHTCSSSSVDRRSRQATAELVADMLRKEFPGQLDTPNPRTIMAMMKTRGVTISYYKAWRGKQIAASYVGRAP